MRTDNLIEKSTMTSGVADNNSALFADLYANRLVSQIKNSGDRIDLTFTGEGALAFARALVKYVDEREPRVVQQEEEDSLMPKQEVMSKLGVTTRLTLTIFVKARSKSNALIVRAILSMTLYKIII